MAKAQAKSFIKKIYKSPSPGYRTSDHEKGKTFSAQGQKAQRFGKQQYKHQHKG